MDLASFKGQNIEARDKTNDKARANLVLNTWLRHVNFTVGQWFLQFLETAVCLWRASLNPFSSILFIRHSFTNLLIANPVAPQSSSYSTFP